MFKQRADGRNEIPRNDESRRGEPRGFREFHNTPRKHSPRCRPPQRSALIRRWPNAVTTSGNEGGLGVFCMAHCWSSRCSCGPTRECDSADAIRAAGLTPPETIEPDGELHRFASNGTRGDDADGTCCTATAFAGWFGDWRTGCSQTWRADIGRKLSPAEVSHNRSGSRTRDASGKRPKCCVTPKPASKRPNDGLRRNRRQGARVPRAQRCKTARHSAGRRRAAYPDARRGGAAFAADHRRTDGESCSCRAGACGLLLQHRQARRQRYASQKATRPARQSTRPRATCGRRVQRRQPEAVARTMRERASRCSDHLCADDDYGTAGNPGVARRRKRRAPSAGWWPCPTSARDRPEGATDFNDLAQTRRHRRSKKGAGERQAAGGIGSSTSRSESATAAILTFARGRAALDPAALPRNRWRVRAHGRAEHGGGPGGDPARVPDAFGATGWPRAALPGRGGPASRQPLLRCLLARLAKGAQGYVMGACPRDVLSVWPIGSRMSAGCRRRGCQVPRS